MYAVQVVLAMTYASKSSWARKSARELQTFIGSPELLNLSFKLLDPWSSGRITGSGLYLCTGHLVTQRPGCATTLLVSKPKRNAYEERFNQTVRYKALRQHYRRNLGKFRDFATRRIWHDTHDYLNIAPGRVAPKQRLAMAT